MPIRVYSKRSAPPAAPPKTGEALAFGLPTPPQNRQQLAAGISLCMIVKNEERFLAQCLRSVADVVDEINIVDTGSSDRTIEIARSFNANIIERAWRNDFAWARNESISLATKRWIFFLDADEELTLESKPALRKLRDVSAYHDAVWVRCHNRSDDYRGTGDMSHALIRIFPNAPEIRFRGLIHEFPCVAGSVTGLNAAISPISIVHYGYLKDVVAARNKGQRNLDIVRAAAQAEPDDPFHWFNLGNTAFLTGDIAGARDALEEMVRRNGSKQRGFLPNGLAILAEIYTDKLGDPVRGEAVARDALRASPHYANAHFQLGKALVAQAKYDDARAAYALAIDDAAYAQQQFVIDDQVYIWKAHCEIGSSYVLQGNDAKAVEWFATALERVPEVEPVQINYARALERLKRFDEAEAMFARAYSTHRDDMATVDYVNCLLRRGKGLAALEIIESAHAMLSDAAAAGMLFAASQVASKSGLPSVERYLWAAHHRDPGNADVLNALEHLLRASGDNTGLAKLQRREADTEPKSAAEFLRRSYQSIAARQFTDAVQLAESGLNCAPDHGFLHYNAAIALANLDRKDDALAHLVRVSSGDGAAYAQAKFLQATILREVGRGSEALDALNNVLALDPSQVDAALMKAALLQEHGDTAAAEQTLIDARPLDPRRIAVDLAGLYLHVGRFADAARIAESALAP